jgi:hypothetical protein
MLALLKSACCYPLATYLHVVQPLLTRGLLDSTIDNPSGGMTNASRIKLMSRDCDFLCRLAKKGEPSRDEGWASEGSTPCHIRISTEAACLPRLRSQGAAPSFVARLPRFTSPIAALISHCLNFRTYIRAGCFLVRFCSTFQNIIQISTTHRDREPHIPDTLSSCSSASDSHSDMGSSHCTAS